MSTILVVDDEDRIRKLLQSLLKAEGFDVVTAASGEEAVGVLTQTPIDLLISDLQMAAMGGLDVLRTARTHRPDLPVILLTAYGSVESAIEAMQLGVFDYVTKPFKLDELIATVKRALMYSRSMSRLSGPTEKKVPAAIGGIIAESAAMQVVCKSIQRLAPTDAPILITGEAGVEKEAVAHALHAGSRRRQAPFVHVRSTRKAPVQAEELIGMGEQQGFLAWANGGSLFVDDIATLPISLQETLNECLARKAICRTREGADESIEFRLLAGTCCDLEQCVAEGSFLKELYQRMGMLTIDIPPLRKRPEDVLPLLQELMGQATHSSGSQPVLGLEAKELLLAYPWPGNRDEMSSVIQHMFAAANGEPVGIQHLPPEIARHASIAAEPTGDRQEAAGPLRNRSLKAFLHRKELEYLDQVLGQNPQAEAPVSTNPPPSSRNGKQP